MKKFVVLLLIVLITTLPATVFGAGSVPIYDTDERSVGKQVVVSANKSYTVEFTDAEYMSAYTDEGKRLTDGVYAPDIDYDKSDYWYGAGKWVGFKSKSGTGKYSVAVTIDFGYVAKNIGQIFIRTLKEARVGTHIPTMTVHASADGSAFYEVAKMEVQNVENKRTETLINKLQLEETFYARYVKVVFEQEARYGTLIDEICISAFGDVARIGADGGDETGRTFDFSSGYAIPNGVLPDKISYVAGESEPTKFDFNAPDTSFYIGEGIGEKIKVTNDFMATSRPYYSHYVNDVQYIVIHNTGMCQKVFNAYNTHHYLINKTDGSSSAWHYTVDDTEIYHGLQDYVVGWHAASNYNFCSIGIEMCVNGAPVGPGGNNYPITSGEAYETWYKEKFIPTIENTAVLTAELLVKYNLTPDKVLQHTDVYYLNIKQCPYYMRLDENKRLTHDGVGWVYFMELVNKYYNAMAVEGQRVEEYTYNPDTTLPDYVVSADGTAYLAAKSLDELPKFILGDTDGNGVVNSADALNVKNHITKDYRVGGYPDISGDGRIMLDDYLKILRKAEENGK